MITSEYVLDLYRKYATDLAAVRKEQRRFLKRNNNSLLRRLYRMKLRSSILLPMLDDLESEITYLLIRDRKPKVIVEMSPNTGWSTTWILQALRDNTAGGQLWSYDLHDTSTKLVPPDLAAGRWHFVLGDAQQTTMKAPEFDYLFIDSDHTASFARWYVEALLPRVRAGVVVSIHDVFHYAQPSEEGAVVCEWLKARGIGYWSIAPAATPSEEMARFLHERRKLGPDFQYQVHTSATNSMLFFERV